MRTLRLTVTRSLLSCFVVARTRLGLLSNLPPNNHHFCGFDERIYRHAFLQIQITGGVARDDRSDRLTADLDADLREQAVVAHFDDLAEKLIAAADGVQADRLPLRFTLIAPYEAFDLAPRDAMVSARGLHRFDLAVVNPLLERRVADAHKLRGIMQSEQFHKYPLLYCCLRIPAIEFQHTYTV